MPDFWPRPGGRGYSGAKNRVPKTQRRSTYLPVRWLDFRSLPIVSLRDARFLAPTWRSGLQRRQKSSTKNATAFDFLPVRWLDFRSLPIVSLKDARFLAPTWRSGLQRRYRFRISPAYFTLFTADFLNTRPNTASVISCQSRFVIPSNSGWGSKAGSWCRCAKRFQGQTS